jgi:mannose-1-phosphate guanylyltransferase/mannose-1-phosphate guanylyltransferase/mannose-6-phosphate isomerase
MITPILLCGGVGTRLWPLSRKSYPKQFAQLLGKESLFQASARRLSGAGYGAPVVVSNSDFRFIVTEQLADAGIDPGAVLIEPEGRNTAPAVLAAALWLEKTDPDGLMLVAPSDHVIPDAKAFRAALDIGEQAALAGQIVTFGITPTHAETGYGWLELDRVPDSATQALDLVRFVEKPDAEIAQDMLDQGRFLWNAGIFLFSVATILDAFRTHAPELMDPVQAAVDQGRPDLGFLRLDPGTWAKVPEISIDYAVMERAANLSVVPYGAGWSDLGDWGAVWREMGPDGDGVARAGNATAIGCQDTLLRSESDGLELVGIGLKGIVAIAMPDAVLVADASRTQEVKEAVTALKARGAKQATAFPKDHRPWGWFETLVLADRFQVKRIVVHPGAALSLQSHHHRSEHWIVVSGTAKVTVDDTVKLVSENQSIYVPLGAVHRMENPGKVPMVLIEVQTGAYLGEDDIIRYEDVYARE